MPSFAYQAATADGKLVSGALDAGDQTSVLAQLQQRGLIPVKVAIANGKAGAQTKVAGFLAKQGMANHRLVFARTLASMLAAGVPLDRSLSVSAELCESAALKAALQQVLRAVKGGKSLSSALESHPDIFPDFYISMVRAG